MKLTTVLFTKTATDEEVKQEIKKHFSKGFAYQYIDKQGDTVLKCRKMESNFSTFVKRVKL